MQPYESHIERLIREATERGEFDNLRGAGKPLDLGSPDDPDWWIKNKLRAEGLDGAGALPAVLSLRKEAAGFPESVREIRTEAGGRTGLEDDNDRSRPGGGGRAGREDDTARGRRDRLMPRDPKPPPLVAPILDVDAMVARWRQL